MRDVDLGDAAEPSGKEFSHEFTVFPGTFRLKAGTADKGVKEAFMHEIYNVVLNEQGEEFFLLQDVIAVFVRQFFQAQGFALTAYSRPEVMFFLSS